MASGLYCSHKHQARYQASAGRAARPAELLGMEPAIRHCSIAGEAPGLVEQARRRAAPRLSADADEPPGGRSMVSGLFCSHAHQRGCKQRLCWTSSSSCRGVVLGSRDLPLQHCRWARDERHCSSLLELRENGRRRSRMKSLHTLANQVCILSLISHERRRTTTRTRRCRASSGTCSRSAPSRRSPSSLWTCTGARPLFWSKSPAKLWCPCSLLSGPSHGVLPWQRCQLLRQVKRGST